MKTTFQISLHIKTPAGFETYGQFELGDNREKAEAIVEQLKGNDEVSDKTMLHMDFAEVHNGVPFPIRVLHCTLDEIAANIKIITCGVFKSWSLEAD
jgi:hypothetical protein